MKIIGCLDKPSTDRYLLYGRDTENFSENVLALLRNRTIGFVVQGCNPLQRTSLLDDASLRLIYRTFS